MVIVDEIGNMLTISEAAQLLHVHPNTLRRWADKGIIDSFRITKRGDRRFLYSNIDEFLVNSQIDQQGFAPPKRVSESIPFIHRKLQIASNNYH